MEKRIIRRVQLMAAEEENCTDKEFLRLENLNVSSG